MKKLLMGLLIGMLLVVAAFISLPFLLKFEAPPTEVRPVMESLSLERKLTKANAAANSVMPIKSGTTQEVFKVTSSQNVFILHVRDVNFVLPAEADKAKMKTIIKKLQDVVQPTVAEEICTSNNEFHHGMRVLMNEGVIVRYEMYDSLKTNYMSISIEKSDCKAR